MKSVITITVSAILLAAATFSSPVLADQTIKCKSEHFDYRKCRIDTHGYVRLSRQLSKTNCRQGRNWDFDRRGIWVDDGCAAEFVVESRHHTSSHSEVGWLVIFPATTYSMARKLICTSALTAE